MGSICEDIVETIHKPPYDTDRLNELATSLGRKTFVVKNPVYEDMKYSGNLDIIKNGALRNEILMFYQDITYAEKVFLNNNQAIHKLGDKFIDKGLADYGFTPELRTVIDLDIS